MEKRKINTSAIIVVVIIIISSYLLFTSAVNMKKTLDMVSTTKQEINELNEKLIYLKGYEKNSEEMQKMLDKYKKTLPETAKADNIILGLINLASNNSIHIDHLRFDEIKNEDKLTKTPLYLDLTGEYFNIISFIKEINNSERIFVINSIDINRDNESGENVAGIVFNTYNIIKK